MKLKIKSVVMLMSGERLCVTRVGMIHRPIISHVTSVYRKSNDKFSWYPYATGSTGITIDTIIDRCELCCATP